MTAPVKRETKAYFGDKARYDIKIAADSVIDEVCEVTYDFQEDGMHLWLADEQEIIFTHPSSALAYLHGFLLGFDFGRGD